MFADDADKLNDRFAGPFPVRAVYGNAIEIDFSSDATLSKVSPYWNVMYVQKYHQPEHAPDSTTDISMPIPLPPHLIPQDALPIPSQQLPQEGLPQQPPRSPSPLPPPQQVNPLPPPLPPDEVNQEAAADATGFTETRRRNHDVEYRFHMQDTDPSTDVWVKTRQITGMANPQLQQLLRQYQDSRRQQRIRHRLLLLLF